jgi:predicted MPP superfamily phosphohydrolase
MFLKSTAAIIVFLLSVSCATNLQIHQHQIEHQEIPESWAGTRILFFADTQFNPHLPKEYFLRFLEEVQATQPEFILIPGDILDHYTEDWDFALNIMGEIALLAPTYAVLGNHDHWAGEQRVLNALEPLGIVFLDNKHVRLEKGGQTLVLAGVADLYSDRPDLPKALNGVRPEDYVILLSHSPELFAHPLVQSQVDLMLAGHSHGGQVTFFGLWAPFLPMFDKTYWRGTYKTETSTLIITNGIGVSEAGIRVFADPGVEILHLGVK